MKRVMIIVHWVVLAGFSQAALIQHLTAATGVTTDGSGVVTAWADQSGNGNHASAAVGTAYYPGASLSASWLPGVDMGTNQNSLVLWSAADQDSWLDFDGAASGKSGFSVLVAFKCDAIIGDWNEVIGNATFVSQSGFTLRCGSAGRLQALLNGTSITKNGGADVMVADGDTVVMGISYNASTGELSFWDSLNGSAQTATIAARDFSMGNDVSIGTTLKDTRYLNGMVGEVRVYDHVLNSTDFAVALDELVNGWLTPPADAGTIFGKVLAGYQGWHKAPDDGSLLGGWNHWFTEGNPLKPHEDMWPDMSEYAITYDTGLTLNNGQPARLYSCYDYSTVDTHFRWMKEYGIDGVLFQRFVTGTRDPNKKEYLDKVLDNVRRAAEAHGRVFAIEYDVGADVTDTNLLDELVADWEDLVLNSGITDSPAYLHQNGRPVMGIFGLGIGYDKHPFTAEQSLAFVDYMHSGTAPACRSYIFGGVSYGWRTLSGNAQIEPEWSAVYDAIDMLSPWVRHLISELDQDDLQAVVRSGWSDDLAYRDLIGKDYAMTIFPGASFYNANPSSAFNHIPRNGGEFLWEQVFNAVDVGGEVLYIGMFDEVDEAAAIYKCAPTHDTIPNSAQLHPDQDYLFISLDQDNYDLPSDWYLQLADYAGKTLRGEILLSEQMPLNPPVKGNMMARARDLAGVKAVKPGDGTYILAEQAGHHVLCADGSATNKFIYFDAADNFSKGHPDDVLVTLEYWADTAGTLYLHYNSGAVNMSGGELNYFKADGVSVIASNAWGTAAFTLKVPGFRNAQNGQADFRLLMEDLQAQPASLKIRSVSVDRDYRNYPLLGGVPEAHGFKPIRVSDGRFVPAFSGSLPAWNVDGSADGKYLYFDVADSFATDWPAGMEVNVNFLDAGPGSLRLHYDSTVNNYELGGVVAYADSGTWAGASFSLMSPELDNAQQGVADLRLLHDNGSSFDDVQVSWMVIDKKFEELDALTASPDDLFGILMVDLVSDGKATKTYTASDGYYWKVNGTSSTQHYIYFDAVDRFTRDYSGNLELSIEYFDAGDGSLHIQYGEPSSAYYPATSVAYADTGDWKTATVLLENIYFANRQNGSADFRLLHKDSSGVFSELKVRSLMLHKLFF